MSPSRSPPPRLLAPAYAAVVPALVGRRNVQQANALVQASQRLLAVNAATFFASAALIAGIGHAAGRVGDDSRRGCTRPSRRCDRGPRTAGVVVLGVAVAISAGTWIAGVPTLVRDTLGAGLGIAIVFAAGLGQGSCSRPPRRRTCRTRRSDACWG